MSVSNRVIAIINLAAAQAEEEIKKAVRVRLTRIPFPIGFVFAMGTHFWINGKDEHVSSYSSTEHIDRACQYYLETFGSMTWRIDYVKGQCKLVERTVW